MKPEVKPQIKLSPSRSSGLESKYIQEALEANELSYYGSHVTEIERHFESYFKGKHVVALNSGTSAIHLALIMAGVTKDDEVLCQSFTYAASAFPIRYEGAKPIFIDSEKASWNICPNTLEKAIKSRLDVGITPKALIVVHSYGMPCKMEEISQIASRYKIPIIEDAAEALGSSINGIRCGAFGKYGILSFNTNKIITASGGGLIICDSVAEKNKIASLATQAKHQQNYYHHSSIGFNYKMNNINAAILRAQLTILEDSQRAKREIHERYHQIFKEIESVNLQLEYQENTRSNFWLNCILISDMVLKKQLEQRLQEENIEVRSLWKPMHIQPIFKDCLYFGNQLSEELYEKGLCLPSGTSLSDVEFIRVEKIIREVLV